MGTIIGDGIAQFTSRNSRSPDVPVYDVARATRLCTYAAVIGSPIGHYWFNFLDKVGLLRRGSSLPAGRVRTAAGGLGRPAQDPSCSVRHSRVMPQRQAVAASLHR